MKLINLMSIPVIGLAIAATSCVDNNYDFSDIDTTTRVSVSDLVVPINIDAIELSSVIDIDVDDPDGKIKIVDGGYAYVQDGDFSTGNVSVPKVTISAVKASSINMNINLPPIPSVGIDVDLPDIEVEVPQEETDYSFHADDISKDICDLYTVRGDFDVLVHISISGVEGIAQSYKLENFTLMLPEGMLVTDPGIATYNEANHTLVLNATTDNAKLDLKCHVSGMDIPAGAYEVSTSTLSMSGNVGIESGTIKLVPRKHIEAGTSNTLNLKVDYSFSDMQVKSIDGIIKYTIDDVNVPEINISDLPDVLAQPGTNLVLTNPCLYLGVSNPLAAIGAYAQTGFNITSYHGEESNLYSIDDPYFTIAANATDNFCFSPKMPANPDPAFANCQHVAFTSLSNVLAGDGLPDKLKVDLVNPNMPQQHITNFMLDHDYGNVHGDYKFVAPLQFEDGTHIAYRDTVDGWSSEDLDNMTITRLEINVNVTTDVPIAIDFTGYPIDKNGNRINNVSISGANINANAQNQAVKIAITGAISGLDGIEFEAKASGVSGGGALSPNMHINLTNIRPCVSGYYEKEL